MRRQLVERASGIKDDLDDVLTSVGAAIKSLETAHGKVEDPESRAIVAGMHSDLFNARAALRPHVHRVLAKNR